MYDKNNHLVIMAGGMGSRLWPLSTEEQPKQFVDVLGCGRTLLQITFDRFRDIIPIENIWVVTLVNYEKFVRLQLPEIHTSNILLEPCRRNTAPCIAYASWRIKVQNPRANIIVTPCDHLVLNIKEFQRVMLSTLKFADETDAIITLGMKAKHPETEYGYIQADLTCSTARNKEIFRVDEFHEKPDLKTAQKYLTKNNFFWNSGIFIWNVCTIVNAFRVYQPTISQMFEDMMLLYGTEKEQDRINEIYPLCENVSIDYAIMEKAEEVFVFPADFNWTDLGKWNSLHSCTGNDTYNNSIIGQNVHTFETNNCIIHTIQEKQVVVQGLDGYIIAEKDDTLLICQIQEEQRIKQMLEQQ